MMIIIRKVSKNVNISVAIRVMSKLDAAIQENTIQSTEIDVALDSNVVVIPEIIRMI